MSKNAFFSHLKSADFETFCDWSTSSWRNNFYTPWCNNLFCNSLDDVITLWRDVKIVTPQGHVLLTAFGKLMFEYIFWYEVNQWFLNDIAQKFWKIMGFQNMINSHDVQLVNSRTSLRCLSLERSFEVTRGHQPSFANDFWSKRVRDVGLVSVRSYRPDESTDMQYDPFRSPRDLGLTWPEVKLWTSPFKVILYMVRRALTR